MTRFENLRNYKIYVVGEAKSYANWMLGETVNDLEKADIVLFTGGEDVSPMFYGSTKHPKTYSNYNRDLHEKGIFDRARSQGKKMVGICRGSQFLCVMAGGELVQHQENPLGVHNMKTYDDKVIAMTSTHHQAQYPYNINQDNYKILAWTKGISNIHEDGDQNELHMPYDKECEIVYYNNINALAIQGHPEMMYGQQKYSETIDYMQEMLNKFLSNVYSACLTRRSINSHCRSIL